MACDVCESWERPDLCPGQIGVASSTFGAFSVSFCREAARRYLEPRWACEVTVDGPRPDAWRDDLADWAVASIDGCLDFYGVDEATFLAGVVEAAARMRAQEP